MPRGRPTHLTVALTPQQRATLHAWQRSTTIPIGRARRGRILLLMAEGLPISQVARLVGLNRRFVYKWVARFQAQGVLGLYDRPRHGAVPRQWAREEAPCRPNG